MPRKKRSQIDGPFVPILKEMLKSEAFAELSNASRVAYLLLRWQCKRFDQDEVKFPYSDAEKFMHKHTFKGAIDELVKFGFIEKTSFGGLMRRTNVYRFITAWRDFKAPPKNTLPLRGYSRRGAKNSTVTKCVERSNRC